MIKTRFAPSPTGYLHVGGLRIALTDFLYARQQSGSFVLRIEDTDRERFVEGGKENILRTLGWAGLQPDEGATMSGSGEITEMGQNGPYIQSERLDIYKKHVDQLIEKGHAYHCFCTKDRLTELRKVQEASHLPTGYDGLCRSVSLDEAKKRIQNSEQYVVRMKMPQHGTTKFVDLIRGEVEFKNELIDDQVILKSDGFPTYHLAVVVDDHLMEITHVIRGEEWLSSTPKHIVLYDMFGWNIPQFSHLPLLLNPDRSKLSKRQGDVAVEDYQKKGYLPEAMINFVAMLGWNPGTEQELFTLDELVKKFSFQKVNKSGAVFNLEKLDWYNQQYIRKLSNEELVERAEPWLIEAGLNRVNKQFLAKAVALEKERIVTLAELPKAIKFLIELPEYDASILVWKKSTKEIAKAMLENMEKLLNTIDTQDWKKEFIEQKVGEWIQENKYKVGDVLWPMRVALSGQQNSPGPYEIADVLGKEKTLERLRQAFSKL